MKTKIITIVVLLVALTSYSQDATFTQFNSVPLYFNPGYAGSVESPRLALSYRNQWNNMYQTSYISYDQAIKRIHGGVGLVIYNDYQRVSQIIPNFYKHNYLNTFYCGLAYSAKFNLFNKLAISPAIKIGYRRNDVNAYIGEYDVASYAPSLPVFGYKSNIDVSLGVVINTKNMHVGFSVDHINTPNVSVVEVAKSLLPRKYVGQLGYTFQKIEASNFSITTSFLYQRQQNFSLPQASLSFRYKFMVLGAGATTEGSYNFILGYYSKKIIIGYSFEWYSNGGEVINPLLSEKIHHTHELSLRYIFLPKKEQKETNQAQNTKKHKLFRRNKKILQVG